MPFIAFRSSRFPHAFLRMDGTGVTQPTNSGSGVVNCQYGIGPLETFEKIENADGTVSFRSVAFDNVFLRLDGTGVTHFVGTGAGTVNCQYGCGPFERFHLVPGYEKPDTHGLKAATFDNVFLRLDGTGVNKFEAGGSGVVNCQFGELIYETFDIIEIYGQPTTWKI